MNEINQNNYEYQTAMYQGGVPAKSLPHNRGALKTIIYTILTLGIYSLVAFTKMGDELNITASKYDGKRTMNYCLMSFVLTPLTLGVGTFAWFHRFSSRIGKELERRNIDYRFGAGSFWLWNVLGLLILVGPLVYLHKVIKAINLINENYNLNG